uniref:Short-chain dehydrogenase/reductase SDR n=1 Tax=Solibacter usitatus (strain Ellin6076) TaxID=234267 RepID=Q022W9_SOLUE
MSRKTWLATSAALATAGIAATVLRRRACMDMRGKVVLITGGSHGLGLALARRFAQEGAKIALCARSEEELRRAREDVASRGAEVFTATCDVSDRLQVEAVVTATLDRFRRIDVLVNNAGIIHVGPVDAMTIEDFEQAMGVMFWGTVYATMAVLPHMRGRRDQRIVNITSIGAKVSVPHLLPYSCAKFAAAAFSEGMRAELSGTGVKVVTIAPGLMRTGSYLNALFKGAEAGEAGWFSVSSSLPGISMSAEKAAEQIVSAARSGRPERVLGVPAKLLAQFHELFPSATAGILGLVSRALPHGGRRSELGSESPLLQKEWLRFLTTLGRYVAEDLLQPGTPNGSAGRA